MRMCLPARLLSQASLFDPVRLSLGTVNSGLNCPCYRLRRTFYDLSGAFLSVLAEYSCRLEPRTRGLTAEILQATHLAHRSTLANCSRHFQSAHVESLSQTKQRVSRPFPWGTFEFCVQPTRAAEKGDNCGCASLGTR